MFSLDFLLLLSYFFCFSLDNNVWVLVILLNLNNWCTELYSTYYSWGTRQMGDKQTKENTARGCPFPFGKVTNFGLLKSLKNKRFSTEDSTLFKIFSEVLVMHPVELLFWWLPGIISNWTGYTLFRRYVCTVLLLTMFPRMLQHHGKKYRKVCEWELNNAVMPFAIEKGLEIPF